MQMLLTFLFVVLVALSRVLPHPFNFTPVAALALFSGYLLPRRWAYVVPLAGMAVSDAVIGWYTPTILATVYVSFLVMVGLGQWAKMQSARAVSVLFSSLAGSILFFLTTNAAVWWWGNLYPRTAAGLHQSYAMGVPFFRNTLAGDLLYTGLFFGGYALASSLRHHRAWFLHRRPALSRE